MDLVLECTAGPLKGRQFPLQEGQVITFGRTSKSSVPIPGDKFLSGVHFGVERRADSCLLTDKKSSNGTFLNGDRVSDAVVKPGDEIRAGDSFFAVRFGKASGGASAPPPPAPRPASEVVQTVRPSGSSGSSSRPSESAPPAYAPPPQPPPPAPPPAIPAPPPRSPAPSTFDSVARDHAAVVGHWVLTSVPAGWEVVEEYGIQEAGREGVPASAMVSEEPLPSGMTLDEFVQSQIGSLRQYLRDPRIERGGTPAISGAEDALVLEVRYKTRDGQGIYYRSIYARRGDRVGVLTLKTLEADWPRVRAVFEEILSGVSFR